MSNLKDYGTSTVLTAPSTPTAGTSLVVQSGHGARFPSVPFMVTVHPPSEFPTLDNAEKLEVTAKSTDTFTVLRAQGSTSAQAIEAGWRISNSLFLADIPSTPGDVGAAAASHTHVATTDLTATGTKSSATYLRGDNTWATPTDTNTTYTEITTAEIDAGSASTLRTITGRRSDYIINATFGRHSIDQDDMASDSPIKLPTQQSVKAYVDGAIASVKELLMPVGTIVALGVSTNPATLYGFGTWTAIVDKVIVGKNSSGTFSTLDATGGAETHTLTEAQMPSHRHQMDRRGSSGAGYGLIDSGAATSSGYGYTQDTGGGGAHNNLQPYIVKYMWQRTA